MKNKAPKFSSNIGYYIATVLNRYSNETKRVAVLSGSGECKDQYIVLPETLEGVPVTHLGYLPHWEQYPIEGEQYFPQYPPYQTYSYCYPLGFRAHEDMKSIYISKYVNHIATAAFSSSPSLEQITVDAENGTYYSAGDCVLTKSNNTIVCGCKNSRIPTGPENLIIGREAFAYQKGLEKLLVPSNAKHILDRAFEGCHDLKTVEIMDGLVAIEMHAFSNCENLERVILPQKIMRINRNAFYGCTSLREVTIPNTISVIGSRSGLCNKLAECSGVIADEAFAKCSGLSKIFLPASVKSFGWDTFGGCTSISEIIYEGTFEQWNQIQFKERSIWKHHSVTSILYCADGQFSVEW